MSIKRDKWTQFRILNDTSSLAGRLPETRLLKPNALEKLLLQYQGVVLKPRDGSFGRNILFITRNRAKAYRIHYEKKTHTIEEPCACSNGSVEKPDHVAILSNDAYG